MLIEDEGLNTLTGNIIGAAIEVHRILGPGLLESIYQTCFEFELRERNLRFVVQHPVPIRYKRANLAGLYRIDLVVEDRIVVEVKSVAAVLPVYKAQVLTYLRLTGLQTGLLINFNVARLTDGVSRLINPAAGRHEIAKNS